MLCHCPQVQSSDVSTAHHGGWPGNVPELSKSDSKDHQRRGRLNFGCRIVRSVTSTLLATEAEVQSSLHCLDTLTAVTSDQIGHREPSSEQGARIRQRIHSS